MLVQIFHAFQRTPKFTGYAGTLVRPSPKFSSIVAGCFLSRFSFPPLPADSAFSVKKDFFFQTSINLSFAPSNCASSTSRYCGLIRQRTCQESKDLHGNVGRWIHFAILRDLTESLILPNFRVPASQQLWLMCELYCFIRYMKLAMYLVEEHCHRTTERR